MSDADGLAQLNSAFEGRYHIEGELGRGGMATVYLAHDPRHDRKVAVKVLRPELAAAVGSERFLEEIRVTANLQHPGILPLFDSGEAGSFLYYVMPFVRGETLRARMEREGRLEIGEAVDLAREIALALDYAHRQGVVHRDIKPGNILLHEGRALVADFGIALALEEAGGTRLTGTGMSLGTPSYVSPEQAAGEPRLGPPADVYSLGCVLYEMLTGDPPHTGTSRQAVIARILTQDPPPLGSLRPTVPDHVEEAVARALTRTPADRWSSAAEFAEALSGDGRRGGAGAASAAGGGRGGRRWKLAATGLAVLVVAASGMLLLGGGGAGDEDDGPAMRSAQLTSFLGREHGPNWSPDGSMMAFGHTMEGHSDIFVMSVPDGDPVRLTDHPADDDGPRWSPAGDRIAFLSDRGAGLDVMLVAPTGGPVRKVASTNIPISENPWVWFHGLGADPWSPDGRTLLFPRRGPEGSVAIWRLDVETGEQTQLTTPPRGMQDLGGSFSPDGERIAFSRGLFLISDVWLMAADGSDPRPLPDEIEWAYFPAWMPDGEEIAFIGDWNLWMRRLPDGEPRALTRGVNWVFGMDVGPRGQIAYSVTPHLTNLYEGRPGTPPGEHEALSRDTRDQYGARVSPDGRQVVYGSDRSGTMDIWVYDRETEEHVPVTRGPATDQMPDFLPDGGFVFVSTRGGAPENVLWTVPAGGGEPEPFATGVPPIACAFPYCRRGPNVSPDGRLVGFIGEGGDGGPTLWVVEADGGEARPAGIGSAFSFDWYLDSRRVVYATHVGGGSGMVELRARHLDTGEDVLLVRRSATEPAVSRDGRTVAFLHAASHYDMNVFSLDLELPAGPDALPRAPGEPESLIDGRGVWHVHNLDWAPEGTLIYTRDEDSGDIFVLTPEDGGS